MRRKKSDFNFWPSFTDLMVALILMLFMFVASYVFITKNLADLGEIREKQDELIKSVKIALHAEIEEKEKDSIYIIRPNNILDDEITFLNGLDTQTIRFSTHILFEKNNHTLKSRGIDILDKIGEQLKKNIQSIKRIQIEGHADTDPTKDIKYNGSNLVLAAYRAIEVYEHLRTVAGINPVSKLMSATSFGEYKPINREDDDVNFTENELNDANNNENLKSKNRRIELLLFYKK